MLVIYSESVKSIKLDYFKLSMPMSMSYVDMWPNSEFQPKQKYGAPFKKITDDVE